MTKTFLAACAVFALAGQAQAYETSTHMLLTHKAVQRSRIVQDPGFFTASGLFDPGRIVFSATGDGFAPRDANAEDVVAYGSYWEDEFYPLIAVNHFFDPQFANGLGRGLDIIPGFPGLRSVDWAVEDTAQVSDFFSPAPGGRHTFSLRDAGRHFYLALSSVTQPERIAEQGAMFQTLGHVVHHIQDSAQPQHVRNSLHFHHAFLGRLPVTAPPNSDQYEAKTQERNSTLSGMLDNNPYPVPTDVFKTAREFFYTPGIPAVERGMAEFTAHNFVTTASGFTLPSDVLIPVANPSFPLPAGGSVSVRDIPFPIPGKNQPGLSKLAIVGQIRDGLLGGVVVGEAVLELASMTYTSNFNQRFDDNSPIVFADRQRYLLPRAVAYSAGLINHFFRGSIALSPASADAKQWTLANKGPDLQGVVDIFGELAGGDRTQLASLLVTIPSGGTQTLSLPTAPTYGQVVAAFRGRIGSDGDPSGAGYFSVAGALATVPPPAAPPCPGDVVFTDADGVNSVLDRTIQLNGTGPVQVDMENYSVPDSLKITVGPLVPVDSGMFPGEKKFTFEYPESGRSVRVQVQPTNADLWRLRLSCPGQGLQGDAAPKRQVLFAVVPIPGTLTCGNAFWSVTIDGTIHLQGTGFPSWFVTLSAGGEPHSVNATGSCPSPIGPLNGSAGRLTINSVPVTGSAFFVN